jgi:orotidine-5'-phosphate decarboxylase
MLPPEIAGDPHRRNANDPVKAVDAIFDFTIAILRLVAGKVPAVKFQSAYFEKYLWEGVEAYYSLVEEAIDLGLVVIGDVKRGDIGSTASAYADAHLSETMLEQEEMASYPHAITVNPFCGLDTIEPFMNNARKYNKGLFVLVRTSNPGSGDLQDARLEDGRTYSEMLADRLAPLADTMLGASGYSSIGAVVGATQPHMMTSLRKRLPRSIFLLPGYGTQGATADMTRSALIDGKGAIISASRSILYAHREKKYSHLGDWKKCVEAAVTDMRRDVGEMLGA